MTRTLVAGVCTLHGLHDGHRCPACAGLADVPALRERLATQSQRLDQVHDTAMSLADQLSDLVAAHNKTVAYAESIERYAQGLETRLRELETFVLARLGELPAGN